jgi:hypothetical protein
METTDSLESTGSLSEARGSKPRAGRQARVGILRNPNQPAVPPQRRPPLVGKWMRLRSSRRPTAVSDADHAPDDSLPDEHRAPDQASTPDGVPQANAATAGIVDRDGEAIRRIDLDQLCRSVEGLGQTRPQRSGIADHMLPAHDTVAPEPAAPDTDNGPPLQDHSEEAPKSPTSTWTDSTANAPRVPTGKLRSALSRLLLRN